MAVLSELDTLSPARLWTRMGGPERLLAARALYAHDWGEAPTRREADLALAQALRSREASIRKMPVERRAEYLARAVRPSDSLASSLLMALHLEHRRPMLADFLDALGVPHTEGLIEEAQELGAPEPGRLAAAVAVLFDKHPEAEVETYLATLLALDRDVWGGLAPILAARA